MEENWGWKIRQLRKERGMNLSELANRSGLSHASLSKIERGISKKTQQTTFEKLALGLNMTCDMLIKELAGKDSQPRKETAIELLQRAKAAIPMAYPIYENFYFHAGRSIESPLEYHYIEPERVAGKNIQVFRVHGHCLIPVVNEGDAVVIDLDGQIENGDIVAALVDNGLRIGRFRKIGDDLYLENNEGRIRFEDCRVAAPVIEVVKRLK